MTLRSFQRIAIFTTVAFLTVAFVYFAPGVLGPIYEHAKERESLERSLTGCAPNEVRIAVYFGRTGAEVATFNFETKTLDGSESNPVDSWSGAGQSYNIGFGFKSPPYTDEEVAKIKDLLAAMPAPADTSPSVSGSYRDRFHLAFYRGHDLRIYHYARDEDRAKIEELCAALKVRPHSDGR